MSLNFRLSDDLLELRAEAARVGIDAAADRELKEDSWINGHDLGFSRELGRRGWIGMTWPTEYGGHGRGPLERFVVTEALIEVGAPIAASWFADRQIGPSILKFGTEEQKRRFVPDIVQGQSNWSIGMSEPDHGSDLAHLRTRARSVGDELIVSGRKVWTSFATSADWLYVICRTDPDAPAHLGLSELIVPMDSPGIEVESIQDMTTNRHFCEVTLDAVRVPRANVVGQLNGSWKQTMTQLEHERGGIDRLISNRALYLDTLPHADLSDARIRQQIAAIESAYRIGRLLVLRGILGQARKGSAAMTKTFGTELEQRVAAFCVHVMGSQSMLWNRWSRSLSYSPAYTIMGGTSNVLRNILGERVLGLPREPDPESDVT